MMPAYRDTPERTTQDRDLLAEAADHLQAVRDHAHWLAVHRQFPAAAHLEDLAKLGQRMVTDLRGQAAHRARLALPTCPQCSSEDRKDRRDLSMHPGHLTPRPCLDAWHNGP